MACGSTVGGACTVNNLSTIGTAAIKMGAHDIELPGPEVKYSTAQAPTAKSKL